jgi:GH43 family beta-xylosidase
MLIFKPFVLLVIIFLQGSWACRKDYILVDTEKTFTNPLLSSGPDPWVVQKDGFYYYLHTLGNRIAIYKTKAMSELNKATNKTVWNPPIQGSNSRNIWAPELHFMDNKWYLYYTAGASEDLSTQRTFVLENTTNDPTEGVWIDKGQILDKASDFFAIDGTVLSYQEKYYFIWSGHRSLNDNTQRIFMAKMSNPWTLEGQRVELSFPQYDWENIGKPGVNEGPEILKNRNGQVFLIYSASGCWTDDYSLGMLNLKENGNPLNPEDWTKSSQPVFVKSIEGKAFGPGHNGFFKSPDGKEDWIIYHANSLSGLGCGNNRNPRIQKIAWNTDGTPNFGKPISINERIEKPSGE